MEVGLRFNVTQEDIDSSRNLRKSDDPSQWHCPINIALYRQLLDEWVTGYSTCYRFKSGRITARYRTSPKMKDFMLQFDTGAAVSPQSFEMEEVV